MKELENLIAKQTNLIDTRQRYLSLPENHKAGMEERYRKSQEDFNRAFKAYILKVFPILAKKTTKSVEVKNNNANPGSEVLDVI